jgi:hypothetical protein
MKGLSMRKILTVVSAVAAALAGTAIVLAPAAHAAAACRVDYTLNAQWPGGFHAGVRITNLGDPVSGWTLGFAFPDAGQRVTNGWSATWSQQGQAVSASSLPWNGALATNAATVIGFLGAWSGANPVPTAFTLNGVACTGQVPPTFPTMATSTTRPPVNDPIPIVTWISPPDGSRFFAPADVLLEASARSSAGTSLPAQFLVDGVVVGTDASPPQQALWAVSPGAPGSVVTHQLSVRACTNVGCLTSPPVTVTVLTQGTPTPTRTTTTRPPVNDPAPILQWLGPADGSTFTAPADILLRASGRGSDGSALTRGLEFLVDGVVVGSSSVSPPQEFLWQQVSGPPGSTVTRRVWARGCTNVVCVTTTPVTITIITP